MSVDDGGRELVIASFNATLEGVGRGKSDF